MVAIHAVHYNYARIHKTPRITPGMAAGLSDHVWSLEEIVLHGRWLRAQTQQARPCLAKAGTRNPEAYQLYLKVRYHEEKYTRADVNTGNQEFRHAIQFAATPLSTYLPKNRSSKKVSARAFRSKETPPKLVSTVVPKLHH